MNELEDERLKFLHETLVNAQNKLNNILQRMQMKPLTLYAICADDHYVLARVESNKEITISVLNDNDEEVYSETSHHYAWESLVSFANKVLMQHEKIQKDLANG